MSELFCGTVDEVFGQTKMEALTNKRHFLNYYEPYDKKELRTLKNEKKRGSRKVTYYTIDIGLLEEMIVFIGDVRSNNKTTKWPTSLKKAAIKFKEDYKFRKKITSGKTPELKESKSDLEMSPQLAEMLKTFAWSNTELAKELVEIKKELGETKAKVNELKILQNVYERKERRVFNITRRNTHLLIFALALIIFFGAHINHKLSSERIGKIAYNEVLTKFKER